MNGEGRFGNGSVQLCHPHDLEKGDNDDIDQTDLERTVGDRLDRNAVSVLDDWVRREYVGVLQIGELLARQVLNDGRVDLCLKRLLEI